MFSNTLLDTGSSISTISKAAYDQYISAYPLEPITEILTVTCADGEALPYLGFISVPISTGNNSLTDEPLGCHISHRTGHCLSL